MQTKESNISKNTTILYIRMFISMFISFYTSRVILEVLGVSDFGIYNVVGGAASMVTFFIGSLTNISQRYFNIGLGHNNLKETNQYLNQFLIIYSVITILVIVTGEVLAKWIVLDFLSIPEKRTNAALFVYHFSLFTLAINIIQIPFISLVIAHEKMQIFAWISLSEVVSKLIILFIIKQTIFDKLSSYAFCLFLISIIIFLSYIRYCYSHFIECKIKYYFNRALAKEMFRFIGCNIYGCFAFSMATQGTNILLNIFFGPSINAARAIAMQIYGGVYRFSENIMTAIRPPIVKLYAQGESEKMLRLVYLSSRYCMFINILITIPIIFNINLILKLWLNIIPDYTNIFIIIVLIESFFNILNQPLTIVVNATGNLKRNQVYGRTFTLLTLPVSYIVLLYLKNPIIPAVINTIFTILYVFNNLLDDKKQLNLNLRIYLKQVILPTLYTAFIIISIYKLMTLIFINNDIISLIINTLSTICIGCIIIFYTILYKTERKYIISIFTKLIRKPK